MVTMNRTWNFVANVAAAIIDGAAAAVGKGWNPDIDLGTTGDYFVDAVNGLDANNGTTSATAKKTIAGAVAVAGNGKTIRIMGNGVKYREIATPSAGTSDSVKTRIMGYGTDKPIITGANVLTGLVQATSGDAVRVGANWASMYKTTLAKSLMPDLEPRALNLHENDVRLDLCYDWKGGSITDPFFQKHTPNWHTADSTETMPALKYQNKTVNFTEGALVTGATSGATGTVLAISISNSTVGALVLSGLTGTFQTGESISGSDGGAATVVTGTLINAITGYADASVTSAYTQAQIENAWVQGHYFPNVNLQEPVKSYETGTGVVRINNAGAYIYAADGEKDSWSLLNILPAMKVGEWGWWDNGNDTVDVYVWPRNPANITSGIEYSSRVYCVKIAGVNNIELQGLDLRQSSGIEGTRSGMAIAAYLVSGMNTGITVKHCKVSRIYTNRNYAANFVPYNNVIVRNNTIDHAQGSLGFHFGGIVKSPIANTTPSTNVDFQDNFITYTEDSPYSIYTTQNCVCAYNLATHCGLSAHSNLLNVYEQSDTILIWGNIWLECDGYATWQETSGITWAFNFMRGGQADSSAVSSRVLNDQQNATVAPNSYNGSTLDSYAFNNTLLPDPIAFTGTASNGITIGSSLLGAQTVTWTIRNNLFHGWVASYPAQIDAWGGNFNTGPDGAYNGNDIATTPAAVWTDPTAGDFTIKDGAAIRSATGNDLTEIIAILTPIFGDRFTRWDKDAIGNTFTKATPPVGAVASYDYSTLL